MKRCWIGAGLLVLILVLGLLSGTFLRNFCEEMAGEVTLAARSPAPEAILKQSYQRWQDKRLLCAVLCDHAALEVIEEHFRILDPEEENFRENCLRLAAKLEALGDSQSVSWANVF